MRFYQPMPTPTTAGAKDEALGIHLPRADRRRQELNQWQHQADVSVRKTITAAHWHAATGFSGLSGLLTPPQVCVSEVRVSHDRIPAQTGACCFSASLPS